MGENRVNSCNFNRITKWQPVSRDCSYEQNLRDVFGNSVFDKFRNHNQALDAYDVATEDGLIDKTPKILLHVDTHEDIKPENSSNGKENIADYIDRFVSDGSVSEIYWVIPDAPDKNTEVGFKKSKQDSDPNDIFANIEENPQDVYAKSMGKEIRDVTLYVDKEKGSFSAQIPEDYEKNKGKYREVKFHKRTLAELPSFKGKKNVHLDIDSDYFGNKGADTAEGYKFKYKPEILKQRVVDFVSKLKTKGIKPVLTTVAASPLYTDDDSQDVLNSFHNDMEVSSRTGDLLSGYRHQNIYDPFNDMPEFVGQNVRRNNPPQNPLTYTPSENVFKTDRYQECSEKALVIEQRQLPRIEEKLSDGSFDRQEYEEKKGKYQKQLKDARQNQNCM